MAGANGFSPEEVLHYNRRSATGPLHPAPAAPGAAAARAGHPPHPVPDARGTLPAARSVRASSLAAIQEGADEAPGQGGAGAPAAPSVRCCTAREPGLAHCTPVGHLDLFPRAYTCQLWYTHLKGLRTAAAVQGLQKQPAYHCLSVEVWLAQNCG